jgi:uncharacterized protein DUF4184
MPLTPAHAAAALLISRAAPALPLAPLVIGTLAPDFEYVFRLAPRGHFGHTPEGLLVFCVPVSLAAWAVWAAIVRPALVDLSPPGLADACSSKPPVNRPQGRALVVVLGALAAYLGAWSHVVWDSFTHRYGWAVTWLAFLTDPAAPEFLGRLPWYKLLQYASSLVGCAIVIAWMVHLLGGLPRPARVFAGGQAARAIGVGAALCAVSAAAAIWNASRAPSGRIVSMLGFGAVGAMAGLALGLVAYGGLIRAWRQAERPGSLSARPAAAGGEPAKRSR